MRIFKKRRSISARSLITAAGIVLAVAAAFFASGFAGRLNGTASKEGLTLTERAIRRAVVQCYAVEGFYPETIAYLEGNYGLIIDYNRYYVHYACIASNLPPDVTVIERD